MTHPQPADLLATARDIWQDTPPLDLDHGALVLAKIVGDLAGAVCDGTGSSVFDVNRFWSTVYRELGNLLLTVPRLLDDAGLSLDECLRQAEQAQRAHADRVRAT